MSTILVVEDEFIISLNASMLLEDEGFHVDVAYDGAEALEMVAANPPDLIIADYMMPVMDGLEMITRLRAQGWAGPIMLVTSIPEEKLPVSYARGHDAYLSKPYLAQQFIEAVRRLLGNR
ncbi:response regulator transcription factor [Pedomonas mirosovicensis]|uniref:response regulator transcription factor n=1 Tax=Pedomonas mirosovicensis TaxID=2908641 RepID=UPI0021688A1D|nr:response regulator [Pedomonas mirosovicensis]MCH8684252.1 response regulator [Pedomonas mirosovicensis]